MAKRHHIAYEEAKRIQANFRILAAVTFLVISGGTVIIHFLEKLSWVDSLYFSVISLTTVGYGDITPKTDGGKLFTIVYLLIGIGIVAAFASNLIKSSVARKVIKDTEEKATNE